jgi:hypothetical protein
MKENSSKKLNFDKQTLKSLSTKTRVRAGEAKTKLNSYCGGLCDFGGSAVRDAYTNCEG